MTRPILLDTCAAIWIATEAPLAAAALNHIQTAWEEGVALQLSPMTAWEVGMLVSKGRLSLTSEPLAWFRRLMEREGVELLELDYAELVASSFLPGTPPNDPVDKMLAATARHRDFRLMTRDRALLAYAEAGHIQAIAC